MPENLLDSIILLNLSDGLIGAQNSGVWVLPADGKINGQIIDDMRFVIEIIDPDQFMGPDHRYSLLGLIRASSNKNTVALGGGTNISATAGGPAIEWYSHPSNSLEDGFPRYHFGAQWGNANVASRLGQTFGVTVSTTGGLDAGAAVPLKLRVRLDLINGPSEE